MYRRLVQRRLIDALRDTRVVLLSGPRQAGKTTLAQQGATAEMPFMSFDDAATLEAARHDRVGFVRQVGRVVIDEIQRMPELLLAIKQSVDADQRPRSCTIASN